VILFDQAEVCLGEVQARWINAFAEAPECNEGGAALIDRDGLDGELQNCFSKTIPASTMEAIEMRRMGYCFRN
jgi:hypothetical protein